MRAVDPYPLSGAFVREVCSSLVHDDLRTISTSIAGYVRLLLRDFVVGQEWTPMQLKLMEHALKATTRADRRLAAFQNMADATTLSDAAEAVADYYAGYERVLVSIADDAVGVSIPFAALPFALWLFAQRQPGIGVASARDLAPPVTLAVTVSESQIRVSVGPTQQSVEWSDETARAADGMDWIADVDAMVRASNGTFGIFTNTDHQVQVVMQWRRRERV